MMSSMGTRSLRLRYRAKGGRKFYYATWYDDAGEKRERAFGSDRTLAESDFSAFHVRWRADASVRNPSDVSRGTLRAAFQAFDAHARAHYRRPDGTPTGKDKGLASAFAPLLELFGDEPLASVDLHRLRSARELMVRKGWCVNTINERVRLCRQVFRWLVEQGHFDASAWHAMKALSPLERGRAVVVNGDAVDVPSHAAPTAAPMTAVEAVAAAVPPTVRAMIWTQLYTGMRPTELLIMRPVDVDRSGPVWLYRPRFHKTMHKGQARVVAIGPKAQAWLGPYLLARANVQAAVFSPLDAWNEYQAGRRAAYLADERPGDYRGWPSYLRRARSAAPAGDQFDRTSYARIIARACKALGLDAWSPYRLRNAAADLARGQLGLDSAQAMLGHSKADTSELYARLGVDRAVQVAQAIG